VKDRFRSKAELEKSYQQNQARNPMNEQTLGAFLRAVWERRKRNRMGGDYLLVTLLTGCRQQETCALMWRDRLTASEATRCNWVDLDHRKLFLHDTKNGQPHHLPLGDACIEVLLQRMNERSASKYVFPVRASTRTASPYYCHPDTFLKYCATDAAIPVLRTHDLRRTFGRFAEDLASYRQVKRLMNHSNPSDPTERYTEADWGRLATVMQRIECTLLACAPEVYSRLLVPPKYPPLPLA
jgi:integrase